MRGGKRHGAGRRAGARNKATIAREKGHAEIVAKAAAEGVQPLEVMLENMRFAHAKAATLLAELTERGDIAPDDLRELLQLRAIAEECAKDAAPYVHPRLAAIEHSGDMNISHEDRLAALE